MSRFALRIFLSAWAILIVTITLTVLASGWLPASEDPAGELRFDEQMVQRIVRDLRPLVAEDPATIAEALRDHSVFDFDYLVQIYVLDADGNDIFARPLPTAYSYSELVDGRPPHEGDRPLFRDPRFQFYRDGLGDYTIVSYHGRFPLGRVLVLPGARTLLFAIALLVSAAVSVVLARFVVLPVRRLREAGQKVAEGDLTVRVGSSVGSRTDDIAELARDFDVMTERVQGLLESRQRLMRDVSHELRSPLARLQALLSLARQKLDRADGVPFDRMEQELERLDGLIGEILSYARLETKEGVDRRPTDLVDLVQNIIDDAAIEGQQDGKQIRLDGPETCMLDADAGLIQAAVENVVRNAMRHTAPQTTVDVTISESAASAEIVIRDHGPGVPEEALDKLFEPFYRVEDARVTHSGSGGVGLAIAERSILLHGGEIRASNDPDGGLRIEIVLPR